MPNESFVFFFFGEFVCVSVPARPLALSLSLSLYLSIINDEKSREKLKRERHFG